MEKKYYTFNDYEKEGGGIFSNNLYQTTELNLNALEPKQIVYKAKTVKAACKKKINSGNITCEQGQILKYLLRLELKIYNDALKLHQKQKPGWFQKLKNKEKYNELLLKFTDKPKPEKKNYLKIIIKGENDKYTLNITYLQNIFIKLKKLISEIQIKVLELIENRKKEDTKIFSESLSLPLYQYMKRDDLIKELTPILLMDIPDKSLTEKIIKYISLLGPAGLLLWGLILAIIAVGTIGIGIYIIMGIIIILLIINAFKTKTINLNFFQNELNIINTLFETFNNNLPNIKDIEITELCVSDQSCRGTSQMKLIKSIIASSENILKEISDVTDSQVLDSESGLSLLSPVDEQAGYVLLGANPN